MAIIKVEGEIVSLNQSGYGVKLLETNESQGKTYKQRYTVWFKEPHGLNPGDVVTVSGILGAKGSSWEDKQTGETRLGVDLSINAPRVEGQPQKSFSAPAAWKQTTDETPF
jgi:hypothetical protein